MMQDLMRAVATLSILQTALLSGCLLYEDDDGYFGQRISSPAEKLVLEGVLIAQEQKGDLTSAGYYQGTIVFPWCGYNPNPYDIQINTSFELYQMRGLPGEEEPHLIASGSPSPLMVWEGGGIGGNAYYHHVVANETIEGGFNYSIHLWHEILYPSPHHRWDFWHNFTFTPYTEEVYYEQGDGMIDDYPCWL